MRRLLPARDVAWPILLLLAAPVLVHAPELAGWISCWPLPEQSGLAGAKVAHLVGGLCAIDGNVGGTMEALGHLSAQDWLAGRLPWWNPYAGVGMPLAAGMQPASFFLPFILLLHFHSGILMLKITMQCLSGVCMFACLREMQVGVAAALLGALLFQFNGTFAWYGDAPILPVAFLPVLVLGIERSRRRAMAGEAGGVATVAVGIGFSLLAGFPETAFVDGLLALFWCGTVAVGLDRAALGRFAAKIVAGGLIGLGLAAPALVTFADYLRHGSVVARGDARLDWMADGQAGSLLLPWLFGPPYRDWDLPGWTTIGGYLGAASVVLGLAGVTSWRAVRGVRLLALGWSLFWMAAFLREPLSRAVWLAIPGLQQDLVTRYGLPSLEFLWAVMAALALDEWRLGRLRPLPAVALTGAACTVAVVMGVRLGRIDLAGNWRALVFPVGCCVWAACVVAGLALLVRRPASAGRVRLAIGLLAADAVASFVVPISAGMVAWPVDWAPARFLAAQPGFARVYGVGQMLSPNYGSYFDIATIRGFSLPAPENWVAAADFMAPELLGLPFAIPGDGRSAGRVELFRDRLAALGVGFVIVARAHDAVAALHDAHFEPVFESESARIYRLAGAAPYFAVAGGPCVVRAVARDEVTAACERPGRLVRRELFYPGWHARVNGHKATIDAAEGLFQSVALPAGASRVTWRYAPELSQVIIAMLAVGVLGFAGFAWRELHPRQKG